MPPRLPIHLAGKEGREEGWRDEDGWGAEGRDAESLVRAVGQSDEEMEQRRREGEREIEAKEKREAQ